jgi:putative solute:sodium symporter small subunit
MQTAKARRLWVFTRRLTASLLVLWLLATLVGPWFARELQGLRLFGFPLGYWLVAQGALFVYIAVIVVYDVAMGRAEARYREADQGVGITAESASGGLTAGPR